MISKHILCAPENDNYGRLANYIAGHGEEFGKEIDDVREYIPQPYFGEAGDLTQKRLRGLSECDLVHRAFGKGEERESTAILSFDARSDQQASDLMRRNKAHSGTEKCLVSWCTGCWAGDDYELAVQEVADTQALNTRTTKEKTYHLIVSFRPEDQAKLTPENFRAIEERFAKALGLSEHQRHCGVHVNTENIHMHIAYNLIHPEKLTRVEPWKDYIARDKLCRELEQEYGLAVDNGRDRDKERGLGSLAATIEAHSGQQSFEGYAQEQGAAIFEKLEAARSWEDVHRIFALHGLSLAPRGAGLVVKDLHGKQRAKASTVHRELSLKKLEARFGTFQKARGELPESESWYKAKPLQKSAERNQLWTAFQASRQAHKEKLAEIRQKWRAYRENIQNKPVGRKTRAYLLQLARQREAEEKHNLEMKQPSNWICYLQQKAHAGDENALAVLRSRKEEVLPDMVHDQEAMQVHADLLARNTAIFENTALNSRTRQCLVSQALMDSLMPEVKTEISSHGQVIFTLPDGEKICDSGKRITFSDGARAEALAYMAARWDVRRVEKDSKGQSVYVLPNGQKIHDDSTKREFERPAPGPQRDRGKGVER